MYNKVELCGVNTGQLPVLTEAEKRQLLTLAHAGDKAARARMVGGNLRLVLSVVQRKPPMPLASARVTSPGWKSASSAP